MSLMCPARPLAQFLETIEVVIDVNLVKESSSAVATVKGGFRVDPPSDDDAGDGTQAVYYSKHGGERRRPPTCRPTTVGLRLRSATSCASAVLPDGKRRTYAKVDAAQA